MKKKKVNYLKRFLNHRKENIIQYQKIKAFCKKNAAFWEKEDKSFEKQDRNVFIANTLYNMCEYLYETILYAKGMEAAGKCKIWVLSARKEMLFHKICRSFGVDGILLNNVSWKRYLKNIFYTFKILFDIRKGMDLLQYKHKGILIGPSIYDTILVHTGRCTYENTVNVRIYKIIFSAIMITDELMVLFEKKHPDVCIVMEEAYEAEIYRRVVQHFGGKIIWVNKLIKEYIGLDGQGTVLYDNAVKREIDEALKLMGEDTTYVEKVDAILKEYYEYGDVTGMKGRVMSGDAVKGKRTVSKEEVEKTLKLKKNRKNIFIFAQCMTDGPHACPELLYRDYYIWLDKTLEIATKIRNVNWIVKFHPDRFRRKRAEGIETNRIIDKFKKFNHIFFYPDQYSLSSVIPVADAVVTARGKVGEELSCYGVPVVTAGKPCYSVWGYTYTYDSVKEYEECLYNIASIDRLSEDKIKLAKKVFWAHTIGVHEIARDEIMNYIIEANKMRRKEGMVGRQVNIYYMNAVTDDNCINMMKKSSLYLEGMKLGME